MIALLKEVTARVLDQQSQQHGLCGVSRHGTELSVTSSGKRCVVEHAVVFFLFHMEWGSTHREAETKI
jgi:hypothetical protein